jgi:hypothetical protein
MQKSIVKGSHGSGVNVGEGGIATVAVGANVMGIAVVVGRI